MKKRDFVWLSAFIVIGVLAFCLGMQVQKQCAGREETERRRLLLAEKEKGSAMQEVSAVPGTSAEMLDAEYWQERCGEVLLFSAEEVDEYRRNNPLSVLYFDEFEGRDLRLFTYDLPESIPRKTVETLLDSMGMEEWIDGSKKSFVNGRAVGESYWTSLLELCAENKIMERVEPKYAICVKRDMAMAFPADDFLAESEDEIFCNQMVVAEAMPFTGVAVLHESRDGEWCFVLDGSYCGWVRKESLAVCRDKEEWLSICQPERFLVVTGCEIILDETALDTHTAGMMLPMGTKIKLAEQADERVDGREGFGCYLAELPFRREDGSLGTEKAWIPVSKAVHEGYLTMTADAVIGQAFLFQGKIYGWGGSLSSNDCSGFVRQVYSCFGLELPRNSAAIAKIYDLGGRECKYMTAGKKKEILRAVPAGTLLFMDGHLMIYLGMEGEEPYVISSCATFIEPGDRTGSIQEAYGVFVSNLELLRKNGDTWLESLKYFQWREY